MSEVMNNPVDIGWKNLDQKLTVSQLLDRNIEAISRYIDLRNAGRLVDSSDRLIFERYSGFGGIGLSLMIKNPYDERLFSDLNMEFIRQKLIGLHEKIKSCKDLDYKKIIELLGNSEKTAYYTPESISKVITSHTHAYFESFNELKTPLKPVKFLEPAVGLGQFYSSLIDNPNLSVDLKQNLSVSFVEMEFFSSEFSKLIYLHDSAPIFNSQSYNMRFEDFANLRTRTNGTINAFSRHEKFDLILSNIPFGDIQVIDKEYSDPLFKGSVHAQSQKTVHGYYFMRGVDLLEKNGVLAYITSTSIADGKNYIDLRKELLMEAKLLSVSRLPNTVFNNTKVNSDVLIFQKREQRLEHENQFSDFEKKFLQTKDFTFTHVDKKGKEKEHTFPINAVFLDDDGRLNERVLGTEILGFMHKPILAITTDKNNDEVAQDLALVLHNDLSFARNKEQEQEQLFVNTQELEDMNLYLSMDDLYAIHDNDFALPEERFWHIDISNDDTFDGLYQEAYSAYIEDVNSICYDRELSPDERISQLRALNIRKPEKALLTYNQNKQKQSIENYRRGLKSEIMSLKASIKERSSRLRQKVEIHHVSKTKEGQNEIDLAKR